jgi:hypothetical protein
MRIAHESVQYPEESLRRMHLERSGFRGVVHPHSRFELTWIQRGQGLRWAPRHFRARGRGARRLKSAGQSPGVK